MKKFNFTEEGIADIIKMYTIDNIGTPTIGLKYGSGKEVINKLLKKHGVDVSKNKNVFLGGKTASTKRYREKENNKTRAILYEKFYAEENKESIKKRQSEYRKNNKEKLSEKGKKYYNENKDKIKERQEKYKSRRNLLHRNKILTDPLYKLKCNIRGLISQTFMNYSKNTKTAIILGCSFIEFKLYLEYKFEPWMSWDNFGNPKDGIYELNKTWDLDHIIPISSAITENDVIKLNHYSNYQPLCSYTNRWVKGNGIPNTQIKL